MPQVSSVAIVGAGTMGLGIAHVFAQNGFDVLLYDLKEEALKKAEATIDKNLSGGVKRGKISEEDKQAALNRIRYTTQFEDLKADLILEAILEQLELKVDLFKKLEQQNSADCILATNTSTLPITKIGAALSKPERLVGMHFFNPAHIMKLVEVISGAATDPDIAKQVYELVGKLGKAGVMANDAPGFIVNRVARHFYVEGLKVLEEGVASHEVIDRQLESLGFKMGPFRLMDLIGVETNFAVTENMYRSFHQDGKFRPSRIQEQKVFAGHHGRKSGKGFYEYD